MIMELVKPSVEMKAMMADFVSEFKEHKEDTINGCCGLTRFPDYCEWIRFLNNVENGLIQDRLSSSTFVAIDRLTNAVVGIVDIRHSLSDKYYYSGHIGYSVRPSLRGMGYGTEILRLGLEKAKEYDFKRYCSYVKKGTQLRKRLSKETTE